MSSSPSKLVRDASAARRRSDSGAVASRRACARPVARTACSASSLPCALRRTDALRPSALSSRPRTGTAPSGSWESRTARRGRSRRRSAKLPAISFHTDDCRRDYGLLVAKGVRFLMELTAMAYGGTDAPFDDSCGNFINLHQG